jgi:hypothetical protein
MNIVSFDFRDETQQTFINTVKAMNQQEKDKIYLRNYHLRSKEKFRQYNQKYRSENRDYYIAYRKQNKEHYDEYRKKFTELTKILEIKKYLKNCI